MIFFGTKPATIGKEVLVQILDAIVPTATTFKNELNSEKFHRLLRSTKCEAKTEGSGLNTTMLLRPLDCNAFRIELTTRGLLADDFIKSEFLRVENDKTEYFKVVK